MTLELYDVVVATFQPQRTDDLKNNADKFIGVRCKWEAVWEIEDGPYEGQFAMSTVDFEIQRKYGSSFVWVPQCDLKDVMNLYENINLNTHLPVGDTSMSAELHEHERGAPLTADCDNWCRSKHDAFTRSLGQTFKEAASVQKQELYSTNESKNLVYEFHKVYGHPISEVPTVGTPDLRMLRVKLIIEEAVEFVEACGYAISIHWDKDTNKHLLRLLVPETPEHTDMEPNLVEMADALGDLDYVVQGANLCFGLPSENIMREIHASNMSKLGENGEPIRREDGKILKGPNYFPPRIDKIIEGVM